MDEAIGSDGALSCAPPQHFWQIVWSQGGTLEAWTSPRVEVAIDFTTKSMVKSMVENHGIDELV